MQTATEVVAHRGASAYAAEHTFAAYDLALEMDADTLEIDLRSTADGELVVLHDATLERTTGDARPVAEVTAADLPEHNRPLLLGELLERYGAAAHWLIELKDPHPAMEAALVSALRAHRATRAVTVQSFDHGSLRRLRRSVHGIAVAPLMCESTPRAALPALLRRASRYACGAGVLHSSVDAATVAAAHALGLRLRAFTVNGSEDMERLVALGVDGLITDRPDVARGVVAGAAAGVALAA
jgi:glycerophosphoryl diester phosphodiesterase